jgi:hypothetical protein
MTTIPLILKQLNQQLFLDRMINYLLAVSQRYFCFNPRGNPFISLISFSTSQLGDCLKKYYISMLTCFVTFLIHNKEELHFDLKFTPPTEQEGEQFFR